MGKCDGCVCKDCPVENECFAIIEDVKISLQEWCEKRYTLSKQMCFCQSFCIRKQSKKVGTTSIYEIKQ